MQDAQLALQAYSNKHLVPPSMQLIPIQEPADFLKIAVKTAPGAGGKTSGCFKIEKDNTLGYGPLGVNNLFTKIKDSAYPWIMLCDQDLMRKAASTDIIPEQDLIRDFFQCGVNSAARCFIMKGATPTRRSYQEFMRGCPKTFTKDGIGTGSVATAIGSSVLGLALAPLTGGVSAMVGTGVAWGASGGVYASGNLPSDVGPTPKELAKYLTSVVYASYAYETLNYMATLWGGGGKVPELFIQPLIRKMNFFPGITNTKTYKRAEHRSYSDFGECASAIQTDMRVKDPVIVFFIYAATGMHYESVIGVSVDSRDSPVEFAIMNTNGAICKLGYSNMRMLMSNDFFTTSFLGGKYNIIRFFRD